MRITSKVRIVTAGMFATLTLVSGVAYAVSGVPSSATDAFAKKTSGNTNMSASGGVHTTVLSLTLPAGSWVLHGDETVVNFGASDYARCGIVSGGTSLDTHATMVGQPGISGSWGPASFVSTVSETDAVVLTKATTVGIYCEHDHTNGSKPYVDADADLWAHRAGSLFEVAS